MAQHTSGHPDKALSSPDGRQVWLHPGRLVAIAETSPIWRPHSMGLLQAKAGGDAWQCLCRQAPPMREVTP